MWPGEEFRETVSLSLALPPRSALADLSEHPQVGLFVLSRLTCPVLSAARVLCPGLLSFWSPLLLHPHSCLFSTLLVPLRTCLLNWAPEVHILNVPLSLLERDLPNRLLLSQLQNQDAGVQISVLPHV